MIGKDQVIKYRNQVALVLEVRSKKQRRVLILLMIPLGPMVTYRIECLDPLSISLTLL